MPHNMRNRAGVTLVELLVVMSILAALTALALMLLPTFTNNTAALAGTAEVQATLRNAQAMASAARLPRGVRLIPQGTICTEMQYLEVPPIVIPDPPVLSSSSVQFGSLPDSSRPYVQFNYELYSGSEPSIDPNVTGNPQAGTIKRRHCYIVNLTADQTPLVNTGAIVVLPTLGFWSRINSASSTNASTIEAILNVYPDTMLGAANMYQTYYFGIYGPPVPLLGEPTVVLPKNIGIDLAVSSPAGSPGLYYDIVFAPSGQTITTSSTALSTGLPANTGIYLWVRDYTKVPTMQLTGPALANAFKAGGEQQIVGIRNGYVGTAPVTWPDNSGNYATPQGPYQLAQQKLN